MLAAVLRGPEQLDITEIATPEPGEGEILLKVGANTVCGTDLRILRGEKTAGVRPGVVLGHEIAGTIAAVGKGVHGYQLGDPAVVTPAVSCGTCFYCLRDMEQLCASTDIFGYNLDGGLAEYCLIPKHAVDRRHISVAKPGTPMTALSLSEPLSCVLNGLANYRAGLGDTVVIIGAGPIGLLHLMLSRLRGAGRIIMVGRRKMRLTAARRLGADMVVDETSEDALARVRHLTDGRGADVVIECTGHPQVWEKSIAMARRGGHVMLFGGCASGSKVQIPMERMLMDGLTVKGVFHFTPDAVRESYQLLASGALQVSELITEVHPLSDFRRIFETLNHGEAIKLGIRPGF